jgi:tetratricopeptide (TPR) repeat protein
MNPAEISAELASCQQLPEGQLKVRRLESLAAAARENGDPELEAQVLHELSDAYEYGGESDRLPVPIGRLLQLLDRYPAEVGKHSWQVHWRLKWMTSSLIYNPAVPLPTLHRWLDELESRYRQAGYSPRPVHARRADLAEHLGDDAAAAVEMEASIAAPRDQMTDCEACERGAWGGWRAGVGDDTGALEFWAPVLDGPLKCREEPHRVLAKALLPLARAGRTADARGAHLRGYQLVRHNVSLRQSVGLHIEFCALTGNEARGLEILAEHATWLDDEQVSTMRQLSFAGAVCVLLRRLGVLGYGDTAVGSGTADSTRAGLEREIAVLCERYDTRNGSTAVSDRVARRLAREPLLDRLPLSAPARLPSRPVAGPAVPAAEGAAPAAEGAARAGGGESLDDLVAEARRLAHERHPHAGQAWAAVAARGQELPPDVAARVARSSAATMAATDPGAACLALEDAARLFGAAGNLPGALEARASAAMAKAMAGDDAGTLEAADLAIAEAETAFADGDLTPREYLAVRRARAAMMLNSIGTRKERDPADLAAAASLAESELARAAQLGEQRYQATFSEMLAQVSAWQGDQDRYRGCLADARAGYLAVGESWNAARTGGMLGQLALHGGDPQAAEGYAQEGLGCADVLRPREIASLSSLRAQAIGAQPGRDLDFVDASLSAAERWDGISEPDTLHNTFNAARAYARLRRFGEAAALFAEVMPRVHIPYDTLTIALTHQQYGDALREINRHREAATEFLEAARLIQDDTAHVAAHARLARSAADALLCSGQGLAAITAYRRAADLFGGLGDISGRVRSLRSAAWAEFREAEDDLGSTAGIATMRAVLAELEVLDPSEQVTEELEATRKQLDQMLSPPQAA